MPTEPNEVLSASRQAALSIDTYGPLASQRAATIILAPCVVGWLLSVFLSGYVLAFSQSYVFPSSSYHPAHASLRRPPSETVRVRVTLALVVFLVLVAAVFHGIELGHYLVSQHRGFWQIQQFHWSDSIAPLPQGLSQGIVQFLLSTRALSLIRSRGWRIAVAFVLHGLTILAVACSILFVVASFMLQYGIGDPLNPILVSVAGALWYSISSLNDLIILGLLLVQFRRRLRAASPSPWLDNRETRTDTVLRSLVRISIGTWALTALMTLSTAITAICTRDNLYYDLPVAFGAPLGPLYALSLFVTLRARQGLRDMLQGDTQPPTMIADVPVGTTSGGSSKRPGLGVLGLVGGGSAISTARRPSHMSRHSASTIGTTILDAQGFPVGVTSAGEHSHGRSSTSRLDATRIASGVRVVHTVTTEPWRPHLAPEEDEMEQRIPSPIVEVDLGT